MQNIQQIRITVCQDLPGAVDDVHLSQTTLPLEGGGLEKEGEVGERGREGSGGEDQMKIAWRYQNLPKVQVQILHVALRPYCQIISRFGGR